MFTFLRDVAVVAAVLFTVSYGALYGLPVTGDLTLTQEATVSIAATTDAEISAFDFDDVITYGNSTDILVELTNTGSVPVSPTGYTVEVYDENNTLLYTYPGEENETLQPGETLGRTIKHTPHEPGTYFIRLSARLGDDRSSTSAYLFVLEQPGPTPPPDPGTITIVRRTINWVEPPEGPAPTREWEVAVPDTATVPEGGRTTFPLTIRSTGTAPVENVRLSLRGPEEINLTATPQIMFAIPPGEAQTFQVTASVPPGMTGTREIGYRIKAARLQDQGGLDLRIVPELTRAQLREEIRNIADLINRTRAEIRAVEDRGIDASGTRAALDTARQELGAARTALDEDAFGRTRTRIEAARDAMDRSANRLNAARAGSIRVQAPLVRPVYLLLIFAVVAATMIVGGYYYIRERETRRPKLLRDMEEERE